MTTSETRPSRARPFERPGWLDDDVWPFPIAALDVNGRQVAFTDTGGDGPVLLLCHVGLWSLLWRDVMLDLSTDYRCITLDPPGAGLSERVPRREQNLTTASGAVAALMDDLDVRDVILVVHDLGGLAALAAVNGRADRVRGLVVVNSFAWRPRGAMLPIALRMFGSAIVRELSVLTGWLPRGSSTRFGVGRHMPKPVRRAWRAGLADRDARRFPHRLFRDAASNRNVQRDAEAGLDALRNRPIVTIFGQLGDYLRFQRQWLDRRPDLERHIIRRGLHFPMCDDPTGVARLIDTWRTETLAY